MNTNQELLNEIATIASTHVELACFLTSQQVCKNPTTKKHITFDDKDVTQMRATFEKNFKAYLLTYHQWLEGESLESLHDIIVGNLSPSHYRSRPEKITKEQFEQLCKVDPHGILIPLSLQYFQCLYLEGKKSDLEIEDLHLRWSRRFIDAAYYPELFSFEIPAESSRDESGLQSEPMYQYIRGLFHSYLLNELENWVKDKKMRVKALKEIVNALDAPFQILVAATLAEFQQRFDLPTVDGLPTLAIKEH